MNKTLILLLFLFLIAFSGGALYGYTDQPISPSELTTNSFERSYTFSELNRAMVKDSQGQYVGRVADLIISPDGRISFAVLSPLMTTGINERLVALPFNAWSFDGKNLVLNTTSMKLTDAPLFSRSYLNARSWAEDAYRYFGIQPSWGEGGEEACERAAIVAHQTPMTKGWNRPYDATELVGAPVRNPQGEEIGKIDDLVFDAEGQISFAIIGYGGFLGFGRNLVAAPAHSLSYVWEPRHFALNITKEKIESAPLFSKKTLDDPKWAEEVYRFFGQQPTWTDEK